MSTVCQHCKVAFKQKGLHMHEAKCKKNPNAPAETVASKSDPDDIPDLFGPTVYKAFSLICKYFYSLFAAKLGTTATKLLKIILYYSIPNPDFWSWVIFIFFILPPELFVLYQIIEKLWQTSLVLFDVGASIYQAISTVNSLLTSLFSTFSQVKDSGASAHGTLFDIIYKVMSAYANQGFPADTDNTNTTSNTTSQSARTGGIVH